MGDDDDDEEKGSDEGAKTNSVCLNVHVNRDDGGGGTWKPFLVCLSVLFCFSA